MALVNETQVIQKIGYTVINDVKVIQYTCIIPMEKPQDMRLTSTRLKPDLYKENRDVCRADLAEFEDLAFALQDQYLANIG